MFSWINQPPTPTNSASILLQSGGTTSLNVVSVAHTTMLMFSRPRRPPAKAAPATPRPTGTGTIQNPSPPRPADQACYDTSLPPRYSRIDYPENLPFAAVSRNDMPLHAPAPVPPYPPRLPQRPLAIGPRAQSPIDLSARFNNVLQITSHELVQPHQSPPESGSNESILCELIISKLNAVLTSIDGETFSGNEHELRMCYWP